MPGVDTRLQEQGRGFYCYGDPACRFGQAGLVQALLSVAAGWAEGHPGGARLGIGDLSVRGGGPCPGHRGHRRGLEADLRPMRRDLQEGPISVESERYSRVLTQELVDRLWGNGTLWVWTLLFNDNRIAGVRPYAGHGNHLHVRMSPQVLVLAQGQKGAGVAQVQRRLNKWLAAQEKEPLLPDGVFGPRTQEVVRAFQTWNALPPDGVVGESTWGRLILIRPWELT